MISCVIVDDESYVIDTLTQYLSKTNDCHLLATFSDPLAALQEIKGGLIPDILFLDVDMPELSGFELASLLPPQIAIVYVTAHDDYALQAFETNVYDFLLKPVSFSKFLKSVQKIKGILESRLANDTRNNTDYIFINPGIKGKVIKLYFQEIIYVEGLKNYVIFNMHKGKHVTYLTMKEIEEALSSRYFVRIHKSYIINFSKVQAIEGNMVILPGNLQLPLGGNYKEKLMKMVANNSVISNRKD
ncbi:MAG: yehT 5 [Mucilaginibacter sp.]|nr:yehT 5 [Mucilaginibacter sp.]